MHVSVYAAIVVVIAMIVFYFLWLKRSQDKPNNPIEPLKKCDKSSMSGFVPSTWGPSVWKLIHIVSAAYPPNPTEQDKQEFVAFMHSLAKVLPCGGCRMHFTKALNEGKFKLTQDVLKSRMSVFGWSVAMHNSVNARLEKSVVEDVDHWFNFYCQNRADYPLQPSL